MWYSQENSCVGVSFLLKLQAFRLLTVLKRDFNIDIFLWISRMLQEHLFKKNPKEHLFWSTRSSHQRCSVRKGVLEAEACNFMKKETLSQVFYCEFCEISKNTFLQKTSGQLLLKNICEQLLLHVWKLFCKNILHIIT